MNKTALLVLSAANSWPAKETANLKQAYDESLWNVTVKEFKDDSYIGRLLSVQTKEEAYQLLDKIV